MIRKTKLWPSVVFAEHTDYAELHHEFTEAGLVRVFNNQGDELTFSVAHLLPQGRIELSENGDIVSYQVIDNTSFGQEKRAGVEFDFAARPDRVKIRIHGKIQGGRTLKLPMTCQSKQMDSAVSRQDFNERKRAYSATLNEDGEMLSSVAFDFSDMEALWEQGELRFDVAEEFDLDPSTVGTCGNTYMFSCAWQRHTFVAAGRDWVFYSDGVSLLRYCSRQILPLGLWTAPITLWSPQVEAGYFTLHWDGTRVHTAYGDSTGLLNGLRYRRGVPASDGSITWEAVRTIAAGAAGVAMQSPNFCIDSDGYPVCVWSRYPNAGGHNFYDVRVQIATATNGSTWGAADVLDWHAGAHCDGMQVVAVPDRKLVAVWRNRGTFTNYYSFYDGAAWGALVNLGFYSAHMRIAAFGDRVLMVVARNLGLGAGIGIYAHWWEEDLWGAPTRIGDGNTLGGIATDGDVGYVVYRDSVANEVFLVKWNGTSWHDPEMITDGEAQYRDLQTSNQIEAGRLSVIWNRPDNGNYEGRYLGIAAGGPKFWTGAAFSRPMRPHWWGMGNREMWNSGTIVSTSPSESLGRNITSHGNYLYGVSQVQGRFVIYDITNPDAPVLRANIAMGHRGVDVRIHHTGNYAFVSTWEQPAETGGVVVIDISNPAAPVVDNFVAGLNPCHGMFIVGDLLYVCRHRDHILQIIDMSDPTVPVLRGSVGGLIYYRGIHDVHVEGNYAYSANYMSLLAAEYGITVTDISDPDNPATVVGVALQRQRSCVTKRGNLIFVGTHPPDLGNNLVYDVTNPAAPVYVNGFGAGYWFDWWGDYLVENNWIWDVSDIMNPVRVAQLVGGHSVGACVHVAKERIWGSCATWLPNGREWYIQSWACGLPTPANPTGTNDWIIPRRIRQWDGANWVTVWNYR